jgi:hypothetical protein
LIRVVTTLYILAHFIFSTTHLTSLRDPSSHPLLRAFYYVASTQRSVKICIRRELHGTALSTAWLPFHGNSPCLLGGDEGGANGNQAESRWGINSICLTIAWDEIKTFD